MTLIVAQHYARKLQEWLAPYCERMVIAGSVRRERPWCNDIDLVVIPKRVRHEDLFGNVDRTSMPLHSFLHGYIATHDASWIQGENPSAETQQFIIRLPKCQLDIFLADETTWATRFLARTGSKNHNIWLATQATHAGLHWSPNQGLTRGPHPIPTATEEDIYKAIGIDFRQPTQRDL